MELSGQNIVVDNRKLSFAGVTISAKTGGTAEKLGGGKPVRHSRGIPATTIHFHYTKH